MVCANNFERVTLEPLAGDLKGTFKLRVGDWRVVFTVEDGTVVIQFIGHRREIYKVNILLPIKERSLKVGLMTN